MKKLLEKIGIRLYAMKHVEAYSEKVWTVSGITLIVTFALLMIYEGVVY